jgi:hypothetical protein
MAQDIDEWRSFMNMVKNFRDPKDVTKLKVAEQLTASKEESSMELVMVNRS